MFSLLQQFVFRKYLGEYKRANVIATILLACLVSDVCRLYDLLLDWQVFTNKNKVMSLGHGIVQYTKWKGSGPCGS